VYERAITFNREACRRIIQGDAAEVRRTDERSEVLAVLLDAAEPLKVSDIMAATGMKRANLDTLLYRMGQAGEVFRAGRGMYVHPDRADLTNRALGGVRLVRL
jgi:DNA-binding IclR family transcriptional regulator